MRRLGGILLIVLGGLGVAHLLFWIAVLGLIDTSMFGEVGCGDNRLVWSSYLAIAMIGVGLAAGGLRVVTVGPIGGRPVLIAEAVLMLAILWVVFLAPACPFPSR